MNRWFKTSYETLYNFDEMYDIYKKEQTKDPMFSIGDLINLLIQRAEDEGDYKTLISLETNRALVFDCFLNYLDDKFDKGVIA